MEGREFLLTAFKGDEAALKLVVQLNLIAHTWDDLIDKDKPITDAHVNSFVWTVLGDLPRNPFYYTHFAVLQPLIENALLSYATANELERGSYDDRAIAFTLRYAGVVGVIAHMIYLVGGRDWAARHLPELWRRSIKDTLPKYMAELEARYAA